MKNVIDISAKLKRKMPSSHLMPLSPERPRAKRGQTSHLRVAIICGGPSLERGISLNSARSVLDHLDGDEIEVVPFYLDHKKKAYQVSKSQLYSNTPSDFDFKLSTAATPLSGRAFIEKLKETDIVFPVMHGPYGEDGGIQRFLEGHGIPYVGTSATACRRAFDKFLANEFIRSQGFFAPPSIVLKIYHPDNNRIIREFFNEHAISRAVVKPASGGSSIGVFSVSTPEEAIEKADLIFSKRMDTRAVVEPFMEGREFTAIILENRFGLPVAVIPTEIETDYRENQIFDYRKKYLPTRAVTWHCPPRFDDATVERIQVQSEQLFKLFGMHDFARFDGWVLPDGNIWFSDFNTVSGMEQNSFLFQQTSRIGMTHADTLRFIVKGACRRNNIPFPLAPHPPAGRQPDGTVLAGAGTSNLTSLRKPVSVLFGGNTSERQVSLMSGTNVWLKLRNSKKYVSAPFLLDTKGNVWELPYSFALNHTVEEIMKNCETAPRDEARLASFERRVAIRMALEEGEASERFFYPRKMSLAEFIKQAEFVFIALHGGMGEDGTLQARLEKQKVSYNGSDSLVSRICMNKWETGRTVRALQIEGVSPIPGEMMATKDILKLGAREITELWRTLVKKCASRSLIVKPVSDGCSSGVVHLYSDRDLASYASVLKKKLAYIPKNTFRGQSEIIEMPRFSPSYLLFEAFAQTDAVRVAANTLKHRNTTGWVEVTVGVLEEEGNVRVFNPSITIAEGEVLSVEEKFQGGTGVNITPPPASIVKPGVLAAFKKRIGALSRAMGIRGYGRIDTFMNIVTGEILIIEVNTLPGLTPSTVFYHQALAEDPPVYPRELLEKIIENGGY
jgi:D-alanine--D-alanine ligase